MSGTLGLRPPYGISNFALLREAGYLYVDKTDFIRVLEERPERYLLYLRPRRFGKSLWLSVLRYYYDVNCHRSAQSATTTRLPLPQRALHTDTLTNTDDHGPSRTSGTAPIEHSEQVFDPVMVRVRQ